MKKYLLILLFSLTFATTNASAGWLSKALKGGALIGAGVMIGGAAAPSNAEATRLKKMNNYVWEALEVNDLSKPSLKQYIAELEVSNVIYMTDTAAFGYALLGQKAKAISVYKDKIVPYIPLVESAKSQADYNYAYKVIKVCEPKNCMKMRSGEYSLATQKPRTEADKMRSLNKSVWHELKYGQPMAWETLDKLAYSGNVSMADTGAYGYAVKFHKKKALEIYEQEILPKLNSLSAAKREKYLNAYEFLKTCNAQYCVHDRLAQQ